jgi:acetate kinase
VSAGLLVLAVNAGSTSLKLSLVQPDGTANDLAGGLDEALAGPVPDVVAHRVVHGGDRRRACVVDDAVLEELRSLTDLAPLHQPPALRALALARRALPDVPHVACFDTAFHRTMPAAASTYALPRRLRERVHAYGFHGLSHAWASRQAARTVPDGSRVLVAHLGGGASLCAVREGRSVDTTMGFTPLDGLVMATRSGRVDPGALLWLARHTGEDLEHVLERESGLLGLCGTADMREVLRRVAAADDDARLALDVYLHRFGALAAAMTAALGGLDVVVLTGGVGEHSGQVHDLLLQRLAWLGVRAEPDAERPQLPEHPAELVAVRELTAAGSSARVLVVHAREDLQMADEARACLSDGS